MGQGQDLDAALQDAMALVGRAPAEGAPYVTLGRLLARSGRAFEAQLALARALQLQPSATVQHLLGEVARLPLDAGQRQLQHYHTSVTGLRRSPYMDYPAHVHLETLAVCTAACTFCPYPHLERQGERMSDALIAKIVDDLSEIPRQLPFQLSPFKVNEPFADHRLFDLLALFNERLPNASLTLTSNGSLLSADKLRRLHAVKNLDYLWLSVNDHRQEAYEATMRLPYALMRERLDLVHAARADGEMAVEVVLSRVGDGSPADREFGDWVRATYPLFRVSVGPRGGWLGQVEMASPDVPNVACGRWFDLSITATGVVAHCCMDGQAEWPIGDVNRQSVLEIYNAPAYRHLRAGVLTRLEAAPCQGCSFL